MKKISILSPLKIKNQNQLNLFIRCIESYRDILESDYVEFLIVNESNDNFKDKVSNIILSINPNSIFIEEYGFVKSIKRLIKESTGKYIMFFLDDVEFLGNSKQIYELIFDAMEKNDEIFQIKLGGGKVSDTCRTQNIKKFSPSHYECILNLKNSIWLQKNKREYLFSPYVISQWNSIVRGDLFRKFNNEVTGYANNWDEFTLLISGQFKNNIIGMYTGWLNFQSYLYPWGRTNIQFEDYKKFVKT